MLNRGFTTPTKAEEAIRVEPPHLDQLRLPE